MYEALELALRYRGLRGEDLLRPLIKDVFPGKIAIVSSFGTESAVLLRMAAAVDPAIAVLFINTGKLFSETLQYGEELARRLGLTNVRMLRPREERLRARDPESYLWRTDPRACCGLRKVDPLRDALLPYDAWVTGRKRYQGGLREDLPAIEESDGRIKINPLAEMTLAEIEADFQMYGLPRHPLKAAGYVSVGCYTCSRRIGPDAPHRRAGRTELDANRECGIHLPP